MEARKNNKSSKSKENKDKRAFSEKKWPKLGPKGKRNTYMFFAMQNRVKVQEELEKKAKGEKVFVKEVTRELSNRYKALSEKDMKKYKDMAEADKSRFLKQTIEYTKKGYWIDEEWREKKRCREERQ